jgi:hypothetical protein
MDIRAVTCALQVLSIKSTCVTRLDAAERKGDRNAVSTPCQYENHGVDFVNKCERQLPASVSDNGARDDGLWCKHNAVEALAC